MPVDWNENSSVAPVLFYIALLCDRYNGTLFPVRNDVGVCRRSVTSHFDLGQNSVTIKCVGHGWVRAYHFETRTVKVFLSLWDKHASMPPMRIAVCFDGRIIIHDHILINTLRALSPSPSSCFLYRMVCSLCLFTRRPSIHSSPYPLYYSFSSRANALPVFHTYYNSMWYIPPQLVSSLSSPPPPFPIIPSTALISR